MINNHLIYTQLMLTYFYFYFQTEMKYMYFILLMTEMYFSIVENGKFYSKKIRTTQHKVHWNGTNNISVIFFSAPDDHFNDKCLFDDAMLE